MTKQMEYGKDYTYEGSKGLWKCIGVHKDRAWMLCVVDTFGRSRTDDAINESPRCNWSSYEEYVEPVKTEHYVNVYQDPIPSIGCFHNNDDALRIARNNTKGCETLKMTFLDGKFHKAEVVNEAA